MYTWTLGASHTPAAFVLVAGQALPYDVTDVVVEHRVRARVRAGARASARPHAVRMEVAWRAARPIVQVQARLPIGPTLSDERAGLRLPAVQPRRAEGGDRSPGAASAFALVGLCLLALALTWLLAEHVTAIHFATRRCCATSPVWTGRR